MFADRRDAGRQLAGRMSGFRSGETVVVGLPRGGVPVAAEVARAIDAPLDVIVVRKLGVPYHSELAMGAIGEDGVRVINDDVVASAGVNERDIADVESMERELLEARAARLRAGHDRIPLRGKVVVVVDDGIATGSTARAACEVARAEGAERVVVAVPVAPTDAPERLAGVADDFVCVDFPTPFYAVGQFYADFGQTTDDEVANLLAEARARRSTSSGARESAGAGPSAPADADVAPVPVDVTVGTAGLPGHLTVPPDARGLVIFAHGSGSGRDSPRNQYVAFVLNRSGLATLLFDLLTDDEERDRRNVFDVELLSQRLLDATSWAADQQQLGALPVSYFGASTGAGAALAAAATLDGAISAVVSRGGRPDLAGSVLGHVTAPTLLIVGANDPTVLELNQEAERALRCEHRLDVVPGATHLFEEPGALETVAERARDWITANLHRADGATTSPDATQE